jgi:hypothetical protein
LGNRHQLGARAAGLGDTNPNIATAKSHSYNGFALYFSAKPLEGQTRNWVGGAGTYDLRWGQGAFDPANQRAGIETRVRENQDQIFGPWPAGKLRRNLLTDARFSTSRLRDQEWLALDPSNRHHGHRGLSLALHASGQHTMG